MEKDVLSAVTEIPDQFKRGFWEALLQNYLDQTKDPVTWFNYLNFLEEKGKSLQELKACQNGEVWKNQISILLEIERNDTNCLRMDLLMRGICKDPANEEEYGARLFKSITGVEAEGKVFFGRRQGYFRFQFDSKPDFLCFLKEESEDGFLRDSAGFHRQKATLPLRYLNSTGEEKRAKFEIGNLMAFHNPADTLESFGPMDNTDAFSDLIDKHERQHWLDSLRKRVLVKAQQNKFRGKVSALEKEWGLVEEFPRGLAESYWHMWTEIFAYTRDGSSIKEIKGPLYQKYYDALKEVYPDFEAQFIALQEVLDGVNDRELKTLILGQIQTLPLFSFLKQTQDFLEWEKGKQAMVKSTLGNYKYGASQERVPTAYKRFNQTLWIAEIELSGLEAYIQRATINSDVGALERYMSQYESKRAKCEETKKLLSREGVPIPRLSDAESKFSGKVLADETDIRKREYELGTELADRLLAIAQLEVDQQTDDPGAQVESWLQSLLTRPGSTEPEIRIIRNDKEGIVANYKINIEGGAYSVNFQLFKGPSCGTI